MGLIPVLGRSPGGRAWQCTPDSCLENPMNREAWWATVYRVSKSQMIPESGRSPGEGKSYPFQYSCLENSMDRGAWSYSP